jgi:hypothetical protein
LQALSQDQTTREPPPGSSDHNPHPIITHHQFSFWAIFTSTLMMPWDDDQQPLRTIACSTKFLVFDMSNSTILLWKRVEQTCPNFICCVQKEQNKHVWIFISAAKEQKTDVWIFILGAEEQNMCEFHTGCKRAKHVTWISILGANELHWETYLQTVLILLNKKWKNKTDSRESNVMVCVYLPAIMSAQPVWACIWRHVFLFRRFVHQKCRWQSWHYSNIIF